MNKSEQYFSYFSLIIFSFINLSSSHSSSSLPSSQHIHTSTLFLPSSSNSNETEILSETPRKKLPNKAPSVSKKKNQITSLERIEDTPSCCLIDFFKILFS